MEKVELADTEVILEYRAGNSVKKLATKYNCDASTIYNYLTKSGVEMRKRGRPKKVSVIN